jgi:hypothetical protein
MFFLNQQKDTPLHQELVREGVITGALWESFSLPSEGYLMDVMVNHRLRVPSKAWIDWLIRKHGCTRIPALEPDYEFIKGIERQLLSDCLKYDCYPLLAGENHLYIGIGRPDYPEIPTRLQEFFKKRVIFRNALDLNDIYNLRTLCKNALQTV